MKNKIETKYAPKALGTYSQAIDTGNTIYLSGQIPLNPETMKLVEGNENQIRQVFINIQITNLYIYYIECILSIVNPVSKYTSETVIRCLIQISTAF